VGYEKPRSVETWRAKFLTEESSFSSMIQKRP